MHEETIRSHGQDACIYEAISWLITWFFDIHSSSAHRSLEQLLGLGQTNGVVANIIDTVPAAQEGVTQDSQRTHRLGEIHAHEAADAGALDFQNVVVGANLEGVAGQSEGQVGQRVPGGTVHSVLAVPALGSTNLLVAL